MSQDLTLASDIRYPPERANRPVPFDRTRLVVILESSVDPADGEAVVRAIKPVEEDSICVLLARR